MRGINFLVVGAGFAGTVIAERIASRLNQKVLVIDRRSHIGGTCWSEKDPRTGIECHRYGSHIFHTSIEPVWNYINQFSRFNSYRHRVLISCAGKYYPMPINLKTINDFFGIHLSPGEAENFLEKERALSPVSEIRNLEDKAISLIGKRLYEAFVRDYTRKQWGCDPCELPADIITRLPVRCDENCDYFNDKYQGIPLEGYCGLFRNMLQHPGITLKTGVSYKEIRHEISESCLVFYSGPLDELFDYCYGPLAWRSLRFEWENLNVQDWQKNSVVNYGDYEVPFTRIHEFKHYHPERNREFTSGMTTICREYPAAYQPGMEAYYPVNNAENQMKYQKYLNLLKGTNIIPIGRLGTYHYWDMDKTIQNSLNIFARLQNGDLK